VASIPLVVDLDGTIIRTDTLHESLLALIHDHPRKLLRLLTCFRHGKAYFKQQVAQSAQLDVASLPLNLELVNWLRDQQATGRYIIMATGADASIANQIARRIAVFDEIISSDGALNLSGGNKAATLQERFGADGFDYVGNSRKDLAVWQHARHAIVVNAARGVAKRASALCEVMRVFPAPDRDPRTWLHMLRAHQWLKNLLLFVPVAAAHQVTGAKMLQLVMAFIAFSACASAVYLGNDLLDLQSDRLHPRKKHRPFASGRMPLWVGALLAPLLLVVAIALAAVVGTAFLAWLIVYFTTTCAYSLGLKRAAIIDCLVLAMLYTVRVIAGAAASTTPLSFWLLAFAIFLFLSLAFVKRYAELQSQLLEGSNEAHGRGYSTSDAPIVQLLGVTSGFSAVLVLALYLNSTSVQALYRSPQLVWGTVPVLLYWVSWVWLKAHRGEMHDDPLVFALRERASLIAGAIFAVILMIGAVGWPW